MLIGSLSVDDARAAAVDLLTAGWVHVDAPGVDKACAWSLARCVFREAARLDVLAVDMPQLHEVGEFTIPPHGARRRDFQELHIDFGLPLAPGPPTDVARFTALYIDADRAPTSASTRLVPLRRLFEQRSWGGPDVLVGRLHGYAAANVDASTGYVEGILGRLVEAVDESQVLPPPGADGVLCGMEFATLSDERRHFADRGLDLDVVEERIRLAPGEMLLFDNLATAHGRVGVREPLELHQLCLGFRALDAEAQARLLRGVLASFGGG